MSDVYQVKHAGGAAPTQAEGVTHDGRPFYFRARHGWWTLDVGLPREPVEVCYGLDRTVASGDDPTFGAMDVESVNRILDKFIYLVLLTATPHFADEVSARDGEQAPAEVFLAEVLRPLRIAGLRIHGFLPGDADTALRAWEADPTGRDGARVGRVLEAEGIE